MRKFELIIIKAKVTLEDLIRINTFVCKIHLRKEKYKYGFYVKENFIVHILFSVFNYINTGLISFNVVAMELRF